MYLMRLVIAIGVCLLSSIAIAGKETDAKLNALDARIQRIERVVDNQALLSMAKRIEDLQRQVQELRGENERLGHELNSLKTRQREQYLELDSRIHVKAGDSTSNTVSVDSSGNSNSTESTQRLETIPTQTTTPPHSSVPSTVTETTASATTTPGTTVSATASTDVAEDYKNAFTLLKQGKYDDSIIEFESFLQTHPESKYAANAQYWLAEANYVSKRYPQALIEFSKVINEYPVSSKVPDAKLKFGFTYYELGQYEEARTELTRLRAQYPNSSVATLAQQRLERMSREGR